MEEVVKMFNDAIDYYGPSDLITIMLSQRVDKFKAEEQKKVYEKFKRKGKVE